MDDNHERLAHCFLAVFPGLSKAEVSRASQTSVSGWDSVVTITLLTTVEEEFGIQFDPEDLDRLTSFDSILSYLLGARGGAANT